jgi:hypothetical protein
VHSSRELDCFYKHDPVTNYWIFKPTGRIVGPSIHLEIERELARKKDLNYLGFQDTVIYCNNREWEFVTVRNPRIHKAEGHRDRRCPAAEAALSFHEEANEQLTKERAGKGGTAHEEVSLQMKTKKSMMQQANSAASLVGSVRDAAREQEGDDIVKPKKIKG